MVGWEVIVRRCVCVCVCVCVCGWVGEYALSKYTTDRGMTMYTYITPESDAALLVKDCSLARTTKVFPTPTRR